VPLRYLTSLLHSRMTIKSTSWPIMQIFDQQFPLSSIKIGYNRIRICNDNRSRVDKNWEKLISRLVWTDYTKEVTSP
jgi:hypothetical protein